MRVITLGEPEAQRLDEVLAEATRLDVSYAPVRSTLDPHSACHTRTVDLGPNTFDAAVEGLRTWACHRGIGAHVHPHDAPIAVGTTVLVVLHAGPVGLLVPDRIVAVVDEPDRFGFAYGTLPGHPERGEESFLIERHGDGRTTATIRVDARATWLIARLAAPVAHRLQRAALDRYLGALQRFANESGRTTP